VLPVFYKVWIETLDLSPYWSPVSHLEGVSISCTWTVWTIQSSAPLCMATDRLVKRSPPVTNILPPTSTFPLLNHTTIGFRLFTKQVLVLYKQLINCNIVMDRRTMLQTAQVPLSYALNFLLHVTSSHWYQQITVSVNNPNIWFSESKNQCYPSSSGYWFEHLTRCYLACPFHLGRAISCYGLSLSRCSEPPAVCVVGCIDFSPQQGN
jgi:hypothetical protein